MAPDPPVIGTVTRMTLVKAFPYRDEALEEFSNTYELRDPPPSTPQEWSALMDDLVQHEQTVFAGVVKYHRAYGYNSNDPHAHHVFVHDWEALGGGPSGTYSLGTAEAFGAGDQASCVWWRTDQLSKKGKPIILRKFLHRPAVSTSGTPDLLGTTYGAQLDIYAAGIRTVWGGPFTLSHPGNVILEGHIPYVTTRTLKRRGKRPVPKASSTSATL